MTTARDTPGLELTATRRRTDRIGGQKPKTSWQYWPTTSIDQIGDTKLVDLLPDALSNPDLENEADIAWGIAQSELHVAKGPSARIDLLFGEGADLRKSRQVRS
jgi:hypothetical protein